MIKKTSVRELIAFLQTLPEEAGAECLGYDPECCDFDTMPVTISACEVSRNERGEVFAVLIQ